MNNKNIGEIIKTVAIIFGVIAVVGCFIAAIVCYVNAANTHHYEVERAAFALWANILMFGGTIGNALFALLMYGFGQLIENSGLLVEYNYKLVKNSASERDLNTPKTPSANEWRCPECGTINQNYVGTCRCGTQKPHIETQENTKTKESFWKCPNCGVVNLDYTGTCRCGTKRP